MIYVALYKVLISQKIREEWGYSLTNRKAGSRRSKTKRLPRKSVVSSGTFFSFLITSPRSTSGITSLKLLIFRKTKSVRPESASSRNCHLLLK